MTESHTILCPRCGAAMNHHAQKLDTSDESGDTIIDIHTCPRCGEIATRPADIAPDPDE